jgi:hypothetical protein
MSLDGPQTLPGIELGPLGRPALIDCLTVYRVKELEKRRRLNEGALGPLIIITILATYVT